MVAPFQGRDESLMCASAWNENGLASGRLRTTERFVTSQLIYVYISMYCFFEIEDMLFHATSFDLARFQTSPKFERNEWRCQSFQ